jgi:kynurenine formamidase
MADTLPSTAEVDAIVEQVSNWGRWGPDDERGALNLISDAKRAQAAALVQDGVAISCSLPLPVTPAIDNPEPVQHHMLAAGDLPEGARIPGLAYTADYFAISCHGLATTHLDALCHIVVKDKIYNGFDASSVMSDGATRNSVMAGRDGLVSRGVLLDIPGLRGVDWLEPGDRIARSELDAAEARQGVTVEEGDILLVSTGRDARRAAVGPWGFGDGFAGLAVDCLPWLHERGVAALGCDGISDAAPSGIEGWVMPIHAIAITYLGLHLIDNMRLDRLLEACRQRDRWAFCLTAAPLALERGTGSPMNPIAML